MQAQIIGRLGYLVINHHLLLLSHLFSWQHGSRRLLLANLLLLLLLVKLLVYLKIWQSFTWGQLNTIDHLESILRGVRLLWLLLDDLWASLTIICLLWWMSLRKHIGILEQSLLELLLDDHFLMWLLYFWIAWLWILLDVSTEGKNWLLAWQGQLLTRWDGLIRKLGSQGIQMLLLLMVVCILTHYNSFIWRGTWADDRWCASCSIIMCCDCRRRMWLEQLRSLLWLLRLCRRLLLHL